MGKKKKTKSNNRKQFPKLRIDKELRALLPPLSEEEYATLSESIRKDGVIDSILVWKDKNIIVDGMNRVTICRKYNIPFRTKELNLPDKDAVKAWIVEHQLGRRNISTYKKCVLALQFKDYYSQKAKENLGRPNKSCPNKNKLFTPVNTLSHLAKMAAASRSIVWMVEYIQKYGNKEIQKNVEAGKYSIRNAFLKVEDLKKQKERNKKTTDFIDYKNPDLRSGFENKIICGDVLKVIRKIPDESVSLVLTSPPYNRGHNYGFGSDADQIPYKKYLKWLSKIWLECSRVLRKGGRLVVNVDSLTSSKDDGYDKELKRCIYADLVLQIRELNCGLKFRDEVCWYKMTGTNRKPAYGSYRSCSSPLIRRVSEYVIVWSKEEWRLENITGISSDLTAKEYEKFTSSMWEIHPKTRKMAGHPACFPEELAKRIIKLYCFPGDLVLDPFNGVGTTTYMAHKLNRRYTGIDNNPNFCAQAEKKIVENK